jgi:hypothetical protein
MELLLTAGFHGGSSLVVRGVEDVHVSSALDGRVIRGLYVRDDVVVVEAQGARWSSDRPTVGWTVEAREGMRGLRCVRSDFGPDEWVLVVPREGALLVHAYSVAGNDSGRASGERGRWAWHCGCAVPLLNGGEGAKGDRTFVRRALAHASPQVIAQVRAIIEADARARG